MDKKAIDDNLTADVKKSKMMVLTAMLFAVSIVLSIIENTLPPLPIMVPGVKMGLSNIAVMYALFFLGKKQAFGIAVLKAFFVFITRGAAAGLLSFSGGIISLIIMILLINIFKDRISYLTISIFGAVFHNIGQFVAASFLLTTLYIWAYLPVLLISGVAAGIMTATLLRFIFPAFKRAGLK